MTDEQKHKKACSEKPAPRTAHTGLYLTDDYELPLNTLEVLRKRYLLKDDDQNIIETPCELFHRVATHVAAAQQNYQDEISSSQARDIFYQMMLNREFLPNSPTLMNAGTSLSQLAACFVLPVPDSIEGIFAALAEMAKIHQTGGGTGFSFSQLRPENDIVTSTKGRASGPVSFMSIFDAATAVIVQGGRRRGANMGILRCDHPDIEKFILAKSEPKNFTNFNLSVAATDEFLQAARQNADYSLINPRTGKQVKKVNAARLLDLIVENAWLTGDPGLIFIDEINRKNPTPTLGPIEATNPCGELPLLPYESCNLASINLSQMVTGGRLDWQKLQSTVHNGIHFLDNVIDTSRYPLEQIESITKANRKVGLGVMGFADALIKLSIPYDNPRAVEFAEELMRFIHTHSRQASETLARTRPPFPNFQRHIHADRPPLRNASVNTIAPTGTISIIAGCSSGIEPLFAISFVRNVLSGTKLFETNPLFEQHAREKGFWNTELLDKIAQKGSIRDIDGIDNETKRLFVTAFDISGQHHLAIQAAFQKYTDNAVSKTINLPPDATKEDVKDIYLRAHQLKCKGITVYKYGSRAQQVLTFEKPPGQQQQNPDVLSAHAEYSGGCACKCCEF